MSILLAIGIWLTFTALTATYALPLLLLVLPYLTAAVSRRAELRADAHAAVLGFGPALAQTLHGWSAHETGTPATPGMTGLQVRLLSTHPDHRTRLHHLQPYLQSGR